MTNLEIGKLRLQPLGRLGLGAHGTGGGSVLPTFTSLVAVGDSKFEEIGSGSFGCLAQFTTNTGITPNNQGKSARSIADLYALYIADIRPLYVAGAAIVFWAGTNSIGLQGLNDVQTRADLLAYVSRARADGFKVYVSPISPRNDGAWDATREGYRLAYNAWVRANWATFCDGLIDIAAIPELLDPDNTYYLSDKLHQTAQGDRRIAELIRTRFGIALISDVTPNAFAFTDVADAVVSTIYTTADVRLNGFNDTLLFTVSAGEYSINGAAFTSAAGTIQPWDQVRLRNTASASGNIAVNVTASAGAVTDTWSITTAAPAAAFNTTPKAGTATFSNANKTLVTTAATCHVIADTAVSGKKVYAIRIDAGGGSNHPIFGFSDAAATAAGIGLDNHSVGFFRNGAVFSNSGSLTTGPTFTDGDIVGLVVDGTAKKGWVTKDGLLFWGGGFAPGNISLASVNAGTGGLDLSTIFPGSIFVAAGGSTAAGKGLTLLNYSWTLPTSYAQG